MSLSKQFGTNPEIENAGVPFQFGENADGSIPTFILARAGKSNKQYQVALQAAIKPHQRSQALGTLDPQVAENIYMDVFIKTVLKGWSNVLMSDVTGNNDDEGFAGFSSQNAKLIFKRLPELYDDLVEKAGMASAFREESLEKEAGN